MSNDESEALARQAAVREQSALAELLEQHLDRLRAFMRAAVGPRLLQYEDHEDLVQSVCREILDHADRFQHPGPRAFRRWLFSEARRKVLSRHRHGQAQRRDAQRVELGEDPEALEHLLASYRSFTSPSQRAALSEQVALVESALENLPEDQRTVVLLAHLGQWSRREIAEELGRSEGAVRMLLHRAIAALAVELAD